MNPVITMHTDEITLKGGNRPYFERMLVNDINVRLSRKVERGAGKFIIRLGASNQVQANQTQHEIIDILKRVPGIALIFNGVSVKTDLNEITLAAVKIVGDLLKGDLHAATNTSNPAAKSFKLAVNRSHKQFPLDSMGVAKQVGAAIQESHGLAVDLDNPDFILCIDIDSRETFLSFEKIVGMGGLPNGTAGRLVSLLSGGIDSPVATYMMMRRGARILGAHFQNATVETPAVQEKIKLLAGALRKFQPEFKIRIIPFGDLQKKVIMGAPAEIRMIVYRRIMFLISEIIARDWGAMGLVTGDSLSQVASQTLENLGVIYNYDCANARADTGAAPRPLIFSPLIGMNKNEIVKIGRVIGTYDISILPYEDCCSLFVSDHPVTKAKLEYVLEAEKNICIDNEAIQKALESSFEI